MNPPGRQALSEGTLGIALLHIERGDLAAAEQLLAEAAAGGVSTGANASLFHGAPSLEFVLRCAGQVNTRLQDAADRVLAARLHAARQRQASARLPGLAEFDLIRGLTGLGALLLTRRSPSPLIADVLSYLVSLDRTGRDELPGWWSTDSPGHQQAFGGCSHNGVTHGIAGPLALLALAARHGIQVDGQADAIEVFTQWLDRYGSFYWITRRQLSERLPLPPPARPSWCYGTLGIARAQQLAALAIGDTRRRRAAEDSAIVALTDPARLGLITDASLCHGWAGLLAVTRAIAADSPAPDRFAEPASNLRAHLAAGITALPKPGFMEGQAGAQLALHGTNTTGWTRSLLID